MTKVLRKFVQSHQVLSLSIFALILVSVRFLPFYLGKTIYFGDNYSLMVPGKLFTAQWLQQGILPLWNPYIFSGIPWIGDINQSVLYPSTLLFLVLPTAVALNWLIISHYVLTALGMFLFSKQFLKQAWQQFLAAGLWMLSTQIADSTNNFSTLQSLSWLPWLLWAGWFVVEKRVARIVFAGLVLLQFLGGYPQHVIFSIFYAVIISFFQKRKHFISWNWLSSWIETGLYTFLVSAVAWMPFVDALLHSTRMEQSAEQAQVGSLEPSMLIKPFAPYFFDHSAIGMKWGPAWSGQPNVVFVITLFGLLVLAWSLWHWKKWNRWTWVFAVTTFSTIIFSLGENLPGYSMIQQAIPLFRIGRYPSMLLIIGSVTVILWFVSALSTFKISKLWLRLLTWSSALMLLALAALYLANWLYLAQLWQWLDMLTGQSLSASIFHTVAKDAVIIRVISATLFGTILSLLAASWLYSRHSYWLFVTVLLAEMLFSTQGIFIFANQSIYPKLDQVSEVRETLPSDVLTGKSRILTRNGNIPYTDYGSYWEALVVRKPFSDSFIDKKELETQTVLQQLTYRFTPDWNMVFGVASVNGYTTLLPLDYAKIWQTSDETRINFIDSIQVSNPNLADWAVKYYLVDDWFFVPEDLSDLPEISRDGDFSIREFPQAKSRFRLASGEPLTNFTLSETPNKQLIEVPNVTAEDELVIADRYDPNLQATINSEPVVIENFNGMRKLAIPQGSLRIEITYVPVWFWRGLWLTTGTGILAVGYLVLNRRQLSSLFQ